MITLAEVLKKSGWSQEQIDALDAKAREGFNGILNAAEQAEKDALTKQAEATAAATKAGGRDRKAAEDAVVAAKVATGCKAGTLSRKQLCRRVLERHLQSRSRGLGSGESQAGKGCRRCSSGSRFL